MASQKPTVTTDASGVTIVQQGDAGASSGKASESSERYKIQPVRWAMQTGLPPANPDARDIRLSRTFSGK